MTPNDFAKYLSENKSTVTLKNSSIPMKVIDVVKQNDNFDILTNDSFVIVEWQGNNGKTFSDTVSVNLVKEI